jgi:organic radical activating enzyme
MRIFTSLKDMVPLEKCLTAAIDCDAPMVSICGGEPLIYPKIEELVVGLRAQGRFIYICTNGVFMRKDARLHGHGLHARDGAADRGIAQAGLITEKEVEAIRKADAAARSKVVIRPSDWMFWNVHVTA